MGGIGANESLLLLAKLLLLRLEGVVVVLVEKQLVLRASKIRINSNAVK